MWKKRKKKKILGQRPGTFIITRAPVRLSALVLVPWAPVLERQCVKGQVTSAHAGRLHYERENMCLGTCITTTHLTFPLRYLIDISKHEHGRTSLVVQWLTPHTPSAGGTGSIPGLGTKIPHAARCGQKKNKIKQKYFKNYEHGHSRTNNFAFQLHSSLNLGHLSKC